MEILSPAGDFDSLIAAVQNGADAVYVGGSDFSARKSAKNFDDEELKRAIDYCHLRDVKLYVACNTLIKEQELKSAINFLEDIYKSGADAVIVQDLGLAALLGEYLPDFPLHASTQMTVTSADGANELLKKFGAKRVVLARELSFDEIENIRKNTKAELEVFVHGALCMSYSGQCLFSSVIGGRSGNRGGCAQPCRLSYSLIKDGKIASQTSPLLSLKDLCLADEIHKLSKIGIESLKIEGRMKSPEYVAAATKVYSEAAKNGADRKEIEKMLSLFSRSKSSKGYFYGRTFDKMMSYDSGSKISADKETVDEMRKSFSKENKLIPISMFFTGKTGENMTLVVCDENGRYVEAQGEKMQEAISRPLDSERIKEQLEKLGSTPFEADFVEVITDGGAASIKDINSLRRDAIEKLEEEIVFSRHREQKNIEYEKQDIKQKSNTKISVEITTKEQYDAVKNIDGIELFVPYNLYREINDKDAVCVLPPILKDTDKLDLDGIDKVEINNISGLCLLGEKEVYAGYGLNITNSASLEKLKKLGVKRACVSCELTLLETKNAYIDGIESECVAYGRHRLMYMENCVIKSAYGCSCGDASFSLRDRLGVDFPIITQNCRNILLNSRPVYMADKINDLKNINSDSLRLIFTIESPDETLKITQDYIDALSGREASPFSSEFTRGHFYRGAQ